MNATDNEQSPNSALPAALEPGAASDLLRLSAAQMAGEPRLRLPKADVPAGVPAKFIDPESGSVRVEALAKSYAELERLLGGSVRVPAADCGPEERRAFHKALGVPEAPDRYELTMGHPLLEPDGEINKRLHDAGFTPAQAQLVYDLAAERVLPTIDRLAADLVMQRDMARLVEHFGGPERYEETARQVEAWARTNLPANVVSVLSGTPDGIVALHRMMQSGEPTLGRSGAPAGRASEAELRRLMQQPAYWRDHDSETVARVEKGFRALYPD